MDAQDYSSLSIPENLKKDAHTVIRHDDDQYFIKAVDQISSKHERVWTVLSASGEEDQIIALQYNKRRRLDNIKVITYNALGKEVKKFSRKDFADYSNTRSFELYSDDRVLVLKVGTSSYPFTIKLSFEAESSDTVFLRDFDAYSSYGTSSQEARYEIINTSGIALRTKITNTEFGTVTAAETGNHFSYTYKNLPALKEEDLAPSIEYLTPKVEFALEKFSLAGKQGDFSNWNSFGKWYYNNLLEPASVITPEIQNEVDGLQLTGSTEEKVRKLYQYMQDKTRYVYVGIGIGGWKPMDADEVRRKGYGDCKALTNYMRAMLDAAGIKSEYAVIWSGISPVEFDSKFPKMGGNHAILYVPDGDRKIWLENTSQSIAFNHLSYHTTDRNVLAIDKNGTALIKTPVYTAEQSREQLAADIKLNIDGSISGTTQMKYTGGQYDFNREMIGMNSSDRAEKMKSRYNTVHFGNIQVSDFLNDRNSAEISYQMKFTASDYVRKLGSDLFFRVNPFTAYAINTAYEDRQLPFEEPFAYQDDYLLQYEPPAGFKFADLPQPEKISSEFGNYEISYSMDGNRLKVHRIQTINKGIYPKEKYPDYLAFRKKMMMLDSLKILVTPS